MPLTRSSTKADRLVSPLIPQKRKPGTSTTEGTNPEAPPDTEASADASADAGVLPPDDTPGDDEDTWSDVDQEDTPLSSMNDLIDQVLFLDNERQSPWTERGAPDKPRHWAKFC